jgi:hypothetical protein
VNINNSYFTESISYTTDTKSFSNFTIDTRTNLSAASNALKDNTERDLYKKAKWNGKTDDYSNNGNQHKEYGYSKILNEVNLRELSKLKIDLTLPNPNFNLYRYLKINFIMVLQKPSSNSGIIHTRITGNAIIDNIEFVFDGNRSYQKVFLIRRDITPLDQDETEDYVEETYNDNDNPIPNGELGTSEGVDGTQLITENGDSPSNTPSNTPSVSEIRGNDTNFWTLVAVASREDSDPQARADIAQSIYNRVFAKGYPNDIKSVIIQKGAYEPTWSYPRKSTTFGVPNVEWLNIVDADTAAKAAGWPNKTQILSTAKSILDETLQKRAREFVQGRTDFLSETQGTPEVRNSKSPQRKAIMRAENRPNNVFAWNYNYTDNIAYDTPNWESFGIVPDTFA